ncbi:hypothetical protein, partial [Nitratireductor sp. ZSWI3]|uniref:hypothetical protein n=1 Tax=Nitratireductor sp. ZSWI3 TaxID=2966359 RepID=UPI0035B1CED4|nr:hypothetical protein [Nitratireductor sp. ZSWI3]
SAYTVDRRTGDLQDALATATRAQPATGEAPADQAPASTASVPAQRPAPQAEAAAARESRVGAVGRRLMNLFGG